MTIIIKFIYEDSKVFIFKFIYLFRSRRKNALDLTLVCNVYIPI